jgi:uncharacterized protein (TIGR03118 family)
VGVGGYQGQPQGARSNSVGFGRFAFAETFGWKQGLDSKFTAARVFYAVVVLSTLTGVFVSVFDTDGNLLQHFAQHGHLSSPWGVALAPASFGEFANDILIGNFGDGAISAYDPANGHWLGMLSDAAGKPIVNAGLWSVTFSGSAGANAAGSDPDTLSITAGLLGPTHENAG